MSGDTRFVAIGQAPSLVKVRRETNEDLRRHSLLVGIPAHNEEDRIVDAVRQARAGLERMGVAGRVVVAASDCSDRTATRARRAGASVLQAPRGKGNALRQLARNLAEDAMVVVDADPTYFGEVPLVELVAKPVLDGMADACVADLFWRPIYPQMWSHGFWGPLTGSLLPEVLMVLGRGAWSGQRAAERRLWKGRYPAGFAVEVALNVRWGMSGARCVTVPSADWIQPVRPKRLFFRDELRWVINAARVHHRLRAREQLYGEWLTGVLRYMAKYQHDVTDVAEFERALADHAQRTLP
jgi:glucosyl-3-phosphoglycerate synthase